MSTKTATDLAALVGEMEALECEHSQHGVPGYAHDDGPAVAYIVSSCPECGNPAPVRPVCATYIALVRSNGRMKCGVESCEYVGTALEFTTILGPVTK